MSLIRLGVALVAACLSFAGFVLAQQAPETHETLTISATTKIGFGGIPSAGYQWAFVPGESRIEGVLAVKDLGYGAPISGRPGAPSTYGFKLTPVAPGTAKLVFFYKRPSEATVARSEVIEVEVVDKVN
jgi:predicted secreted protein